MGRCTALSLTILLAAPATSADPPPSSIVNAVGLPRAPEFTLESTTGRTRHLRDFLGRVVIIIYEDRESNQQNNALKEDLAARARRADLSRDISLVAVANLSAYDFWPARGYARDAVLEISRQMGHELMIDWSGAMSTAYRFRPGRSHVMVLARDGRVLFRHAGPMSAQMRESFFALLEEAARSPR